MNEWQIAGIMCGCVLAIWVALLITLELWVYVWAWVDDSKPGKNWLINYFKKFNKWKYPVYNGQYRDGMEIFGYAKDKKFNNSSVWELKVDKDYKYTHCVTGVICHVILYSSLMPIVLLCCFKVYPLAIACITLITIMFLARFTRRLSKKFKLHVEDKDAHNDKEEVDINAG